MAADEICVSVNGVLTRLTAILDEDGNRARQGNGYAYMTADGAVMTVIFQNEQRQTGTPSPAAACSVTAPGTAPAAACSLPAPVTAPAAACSVPASDTTLPTAGSVTQQAVADTPDVRDGAADESCELWSARKTRFLIAGYKERKPLLGKKGGFR